MILVGGPAVPAIARHRAAIHWWELSRPLSLALADGLLSEGDSFHDHGCGHGDDVRLLRERGYDAVGWDPVHRPDGERRAADVVNLGFVLNVIENADERIEVAKTAWSLARRLLVIAVRTKNDAPLFPGEKFEDGYCTRLNTFQKFFEQEELRTWIDAALNVMSLAAGPGVFYIFRNDQERERVAASRFRRGPTRTRLTPDELFERYEVLLQPIVDFVSDRGRLPHVLEVEPQLLERIQSDVGGFKRACTIVRAAFDQDEWTAIELLRSEDLLIYLALARFQGRPSFTSLPQDLQYDIRTFFRNYTRACTLADEVLLSAGDMRLVSRACRASSVGKTTPSALYVHASALESIPALLRVYEGCARSFVGRVDAANVIKLHHDSPAVSYLAYPSFERDPHPALATALHVRLQERRMETRDFQASTNPPILHRKELFLDPSHPLRSRFARLTAQEERAGLYKQLDTIGTREGWTTILRASGWVVRGHRLVRT